MARESRPARRRLLPRLLLASASALVSLLLIELAVRHLFAGEVDPGRIAERNARTNFGAFTRPSTIPGLIYELRPDVRLAGLGLPAIAISRFGPYRVDAAGEGAVPAGAVRIAVLGDSTPFGWGVPFAAGYPEVWRASLSSSLQRPVAVRNFSAPGYNTLQQRLILEHYALAWRPHLLLLHYDHNDWEPAIHEKPASYLDPAYGDNRLGSALVKLVRRRLRIAGETRRRTRLVAATHPEVDGYAYSGPLYERHLAELARIGEIAGDRGIPILALIFDAFLSAEKETESEHYRRLHRPLVTALSGSGFHLLELYHPYQRLMAEQGWRDLSPLWLAPDDAHPSPAGHRLIAQALERYVAGGSPLLEEIVGAASVRLPESEPRTLNRE